MTVTRGQTASRVVSASDGIYVMSHPAQGTASASGMTVTYTPAASGAASASFIIAASNGCYLSPYRTINVTINEIAPTATDYVGSTAFRTPLTFTPTATSATTLAVISQPANGTASVSGMSIVYTPNQGFLGGADPFAWSATGSGGTASATATITVGAPALPTVTGGAISAAFNQPGSITLAGTGHDSFAVDTGPAHGSVQIAGNVATYTPATDYIGSDPFTVIAIGPGGTSPTPANVAVEVAPPAKPTLSGGVMNLAFNQVGTHDFAPSDGTLSIVTAPTHGTVTLAGGVATYTPSTNYIGPDSFSATATNLGGAGLTTAVNVTVAAPAAPSVAAATAATAFETPITFTLPVSGQYGSLAVVAPPAHGSIVIVGDQATYTPDANYVGGDSFGFQATGFGGLSNIENAVLTVASPGVPAISDATVQTLMDAPVVIPLAVSGVYGGITIDTIPAIGSVTLAGTDATFTPGPGFIGQETFSVTASGPGGVSLPATITVDVKAPPPPPPPPPPAEDPAPVAAPQTKAGEKGQPIVFRITPQGAIEQLQGARLRAAAPKEEPVAALARVELVSQPSTGSAHVEDFNVVFVPPTDWTGRAQFDYRIVNAKGKASNAASLTAIISELPRPAPELFGSGWAGKPVTVELTDGASGGPFTGARIVGMTPPEAGEVSVTPAAGGKFKLLYKPAGTFFGEVLVRYTLSNSEGEGSEGLVRLAIRERPDPGRDPDVTGLVNAQANALQRFGAAQVGNVHRRMEAARSGSARSVAISLVPMRSTADAFEDPGRDKARTTGPVPALAIADGDAVSPTSTPASPARNEAGAWVGGVVELGSRNTKASRSGVDFETGGISLGVDKRISDELLVGAGLGYGRDMSEVGDKGTKSEATSVSAFVYSSYLIGERGYFEGVLGLSRMTFETKRYASEVGKILTGERDGSSIFGSVSGGLNVARGGWVLNPYGRLEWTLGDLKGYSEAGDDTFALRFRAHSVDSLTAALGLKADYPMRRWGGELTPSLRAEYRQAVRSSGSPLVSYDDWEASPLYRVNLSPYESSSLVLGTGLGWYGLGGWTFTMDAEGSVFDRYGSSIRLRIGGSGKF